VYCVFAIGITGGRTGAFAFDVGGDVGLFLETADVGTVIVVDVNVVGITPVD